MKIYNPFKKIKELNNELEALESYNSTLKEEIKENREKHKCGEWCNGCKHLTETNHNGYFGQYKVNFCMLDNPCKDRETENE